MSDDSLVATRARRANAGSRLRQLIELEEQADRRAVIVNEDDENVNLLFQEDDNDEEFEEEQSEEEEEEGEEEEQDEQEEGQGEADDSEDERPAVNSDDVLSDSDISLSDTDEEEGEKELQTQERVKKRKMKKKGSVIPTIKKAKVETPQKTKQKSLITSDSLLTSIRRSSSRASAMENKQALIERLKESEKRRASTTPIVRVKEREMTQEERLAEAVETERANIESLNQFREQEVVKNEYRKQLLLLKRRKLTNIVRLVSKDSYVTPNEEMAELKRLHAIFMHKLRRKPGRKRKEAEDELVNRRLPWEIDSDLPYVKKMREEEEKAEKEAKEKEEKKNEEEKKESEKEETEIQKNESEIVKEDSETDKEDSQLETKEEKDQKEEEKEKEDDPVIETSVEPKDETTVRAKSAPSQEVSQEAQVVQEENVNEKQMNTQIPEATETAEAAEIPEATESSEIKFEENQDKPLKSDQTDDMEVDKPSSLDQANDMEVDKPVETSDQALDKPSETPDQEQKEKKVTFADEVRAESEPYEEEYEEVPEGEIFEGPSQRVARNLLYFIDFEDDYKLNGYTIKTALFGTASHFPASRRFKDLKTIIKIGRKEQRYNYSKPEKDDLFTPASEITEESSIFDDLKKLPRLGVAQEFFEEEEEDNSKDDTIINIKTEAPSGLYLPNGNKKNCLITGGEVKYFDPANGLPYSSVETYKILKTIEQGNVPWLSFGGDFNSWGPGEIYLGARDGSVRHAKGVPEGFE